MAYSGPGTMDILEADLALSEGEDTRTLGSEDDRTRQSPPSVVPTLLPPPLASVNNPQPVSFKRAIEDANTSEEDLSPVTKTTRVGTSSPLSSRMHGEFPPLLPPGSPSRPSPSTSLLRTPQPSPLQLPAFAPREDYFKLRFLDNPGVNVKIRWLSEVNKVFCLERTLAEVKMSAATSTFVYISRKRHDIVQRVVTGEFLALKLQIVDSPERPRKLPSYLVTRYPVEVDPSLAKELQGVYSARRFYQEGKPLNRLVITWCLQEPPPSSVSFNFLPCLPPCELHRMNNDSPTCYRCWGSGHISRYCSAVEKCAWCSGPHDSRSCRYQGPRPLLTGADAPPPPSPPSDVTSNWQCPRCHKRGVSVWHGCPRRPASATTQPAAPPPPPTLPTSSASSSPSLPPQVIALQGAVEELKIRYASFESRLDALEAKLDALASSQATVEASVKTLAEAQQAVVTTLSSLTQRFDTITQRLGVLPDPTPSRDALSAASPSSGSRPRFRKENGSR